MFLSVPWDQVTIPAYLQAIGDVRRRKYSDETTRDYIILTKLFFTWMIEHGIVSADMLPQLRKIKPPAPPKPNIQSEKLLAEEDVLKMIRAAPLLRDKALITTWYECGARANEISGMMWGDIVFEDQTARITIRDTKENTRRTAFVIAGLEHLIAWRNAYPGLAAGENPVFITRSGGRLRYANMVKMYHCWQDAAGIPRGPTHYMRKSRATNLVLQNMPEHVIKSILWNNQKTSCYDAYVHITENDVRDGLLTNYGLRAPTTAQTPTIPIQCPACRFVNAPDSAYCRHCGQPLTDEGRTLQDAMRERLEVIGTGRASRDVKNMSDEDLLAELMRRRR